MSILSYNGGAVVAMKGKNCVALASDLRYGVELRTVTTDFPKVFEITPHLWVGLPGLATDIQTVLQKLRWVQLGVVNLVFRAILLDQNVKSSILQKIKW